MSRLIAFGCSLTRGDGLESSDHAWPNVLADNLDMICVNMASSGSSNKKIWKAVIDFDFQEGDKVFIHWSFPERTTIFKKSGTVDIGPWQTESKHYYRYIYDEEDSLLTSKLLVDHANYVLKDKEIEVYNLVPDEDVKSILMLTDKANTHIPVYIKSLAVNYPKALDNLHPGKECHEVVAKEICKYITSDVKMKKCLIKIYNHRTECSDYKDFDNVIESILVEEYGEEFVFDFDVWWRKASVDFRVRNYPLDNRGWDDNNKSSTAVWESADTVDSFVDYFFKHDMFTKFKTALAKHDWTVEGPVVE